MTGHTPGPWHLEGFKIVGPEHRSWHNCQKIATAWYCYRGDSTDVEQNHANARLIAASPELRDMLQRNLDAWEDEELYIKDDHSELIDATRLLLERLEP